MATVVGITNWAALTTALDAGLHDPAWSQAYAGWASLVATLVVGALNVWVLVRVSRLPIKQAQAADRAKLERALVTAYAAHLLLYKAFNRLQNHPPVWGISLRSTEATQFDVALDMLARAQAEGAGGSELMGQIQTAMVCAAGFYREIENSVDDVMARDLLAGRADEIAKIQANMTAIGQELDAAGIRYAGPTVVIEMSGRATAGAHGRASPG